MNDTQSLGLVGAAAVAPALWPSLAAAVPPVLLGAGLVAVLVWLLREEEDKPKTAPAAPDNGPAGAAPSEANSPNGQRQQRILEVESQIARKRREVEHLRADLANLDRAIAAPRAALREAGAARTAPPVTTKSVAPAPPVTAPLAPKPPQAGAAPAPGPAIAKTAPTPSTAPAESPGPGQITRGTFRLVAPKVNRDDLAAIFRDGQRLTRKAAVAALVARGVAKSTACHALRPGGRFADVLAVGEDGLLAFQG